MCTWRYSTTQHICSNVWGNDFRLIDLDYSGKEGEDNDPRDWNNALWPISAVGGAVLKAERDTIMTKTMHIFSSLESGLGLKGY
jgi:hypothetical protein